MSTSASLEFSYSKAYTTTVPEMWIFSEQCGLRLGMWYWKDETKTLEFKRLTDKRFASRDEKAAKALEKRSQQGNVTLDDVKFVALLSLQDTEMQRICSFTTFLRNKNLDSFLMALLYYLSYYLQRLSMEKNPQSRVVGLIEKKEVELVVNKLEDAQKYLAQKYCILVLGLGMADKHHLSCGKEKISDTQKDWKFFEHEDEASGGEKKRMTLVQFRVGILGEPRNLFNPNTLLPLELEENTKPSGRSSSIVETNNTKIQNTLSLVMSKLASPSTCPK